MTQLTNWIVRGFATSGFSNRNQEDRPLRCSATVAGWCAAPRKLIATPSSAGDGAAPKVGQAPIKVAIRAEGPSQHRAANIGIGGAGEPCCSQCFSQQQGVCQAPPAGDVGDHRREQGPWHEKQRQLERNRSLPTRSARPRARLPTHRCAFQGSRSHEHRHEVDQRPPQSRFCQQALHRSSRRRATNREADRRPQHAPPHRG